jgi:cyanophycinase-like exopeptidase
MKRILFALFLKFCVASVYAQTNTIVFEDFEGVTFPPTDWITLDYDGDGKNWYHRTDSQAENKLASSMSYESGALSPHNLLITTQLDLSGYTENDRLRLAYRISATGNNYYFEHYKVVLSTTGNEFSDFASGTILHEETLTQAESGWNFKTRIIDIEEYYGQQFWLAWVHFNCTNQDGLLLDNIHIYEGDDPEADPPYISWMVGSAEDTETQNHQAGIVLAGGGGDNNDAMKWFLNRADGGDVVVIRADGADGYNSYLFNSLGVTVNSVETLRIPSREAAEHPYVAQQILNAEALFIAGGDQYDYYQFWKDTPVMDAINFLINEKGVPVGGTSAGMAILGKVYYTPSGSGAVSETVLNNPYHSSMNIIGRNDFINTSVLENTITDTHFDQRDRSGRLFTFLSRMVTDWGIDAKGIAANEYTAVCIDIDGKAYVFGDPNYSDYAYFLKSQGCTPETCTSGQKLTWDCNQKAVKVFRIQGKKTNPDYFDLNTWSEGSEGVWQYWYAIDGVLNKNDENSALPINSSNGFNVYPNPANSKLWVEAAENALQIVEIYSTTGQKITVKPIKNEQNTLSEIDISFLPNGIYLLKICTEYDFFVERFVKSK